MDTRYETTIASLELLINNLNHSRNLYYKVQRLNVDYLDFIKPLFEQKDKFLSKLLIEYRRITKREFPLSLSMLNYVITYNNVGILEECLNVEKHLVRLYTDTIEKDIMWEVLPLLAHQLNILKASEELLLNYIDDYKMQNSSILIDYSRHPALVN